MKRNVYLKMRSLSDARATFAEAFEWENLRGSETVATAESLGGITAEPVFARYSSPGYHGAAMDGYAVRAEQTFGASEEHPFQLQRGLDVHPVNTGQPLPEGTNAVIMIEHVQQLEGNRLEIEAAAFPWQHVRRVGDAPVTLVQGPSLGLVHDAYADLRVGGNLMQRRVDPALEEFR